MKHLKEPWMTQQEIRSAMINELCDAGELIRLGDDFFEDMGGHVLHESNLDGYIENYLKNLTLAERTEVIERIGGTK